MCLMLCAPIDWQYAELPSSASDAVSCCVLVGKMWDISTNRRKKKKEKIETTEIIGGATQDNTEQKSDWEKTVG